MENKDGGKTRKKTASTSVSAAAAAAHIVFVCEYKGFNFYKKNQEL